MQNVRRYWPLFAALLVFLTCSEAAFGQIELASKKVERYRAVVALVDSGNPKAALAYAKAEGDPTVLTFARWLTLGTGDLGLAATFRFFRTNDKWPFPRKLRVRTEASISGQWQSPEVVVAYFEAHPPVTLLGAANHARALDEAGDGARAGAVARAAWLDRRLEVASAEQQAEFVAIAGSFLTPEVHFSRAAYLVADEKYELAGNLRQYMTESDANFINRVLECLPFDSVKKRKRFVEYLNQEGKNYRDLEITRLFVLRFYRSSTNRGSAAALLPLLDESASDSKFGHQWWRERRIITRWLLEKESFADAYRLIANYVVRYPKELAKKVNSEISFLSGWVALRLLGEADGAVNHFTEMRKHSENEEELAESYYWRARAFEASGNEILASQAFGAAARYYFTFYGLASLAKVGSDTSLTSYNTTVSDVARASEVADLWEVLTFLTTIRSPTVTRAVGERIASAAQTTLERNALALFAADRGNYPIAIVAAGMAARDQGTVLASGYPVPKEIEELHQGSQSKFPLALILALVRQQNLFDREAVGRNGAVGWMHISPITGRRVAAELGEPFSLDRLREDDSFNFRIGIYELDRLFVKYSGYYPLIVAAYIAGSSSVDDWIGRFGDPRIQEIDTIDWIERIPFVDTPEQVRRILATAEIYRAVLEEKPVTGKGLLGTRSPL